MLGQHEDTRDASKEIVVCVGKLSEKRSSDAQSSMHSNSGNFPSRSGSGAPMIIQDV